MSTADTATEKKRDFEIHYSETAEWCVAIVAQDEAEAWEIWRDKKYDLMEEAIEVYSGGTRDVTLHPVDEVPAEKENS